MSRTPRRLVGPTFMQALRLLVLGLKVLYFEIETAEWTPAHAVVLWSCTVASSTAIDRAYLLVLYMLPAVEYLAPK